MFEDEPDNVAFAGNTIPLNSGLVSIIGGRGTGKSILIDYISAGLGQNDKQKRFTKSDKVTIERQTSLKDKALLNSDVCNTVCCMQNRLTGVDWARKPKKLESFQLEKLSLLRSLGYLAQTKQSVAFAQTEANARKNIQQINKFRWEEDSKSLPV